MKQKIGISAQEKPWLKLVPVFEVDYITYNELVAYIHNISGKILKSYFKFFHATFCQPNQSCRENIYVLQ